MPDENPLYRAYREAAGPDAEPLTGAHLAEALRYWYLLQQVENPTPYMCFVCNRPCTAAEAWSSSFTAEDMSFGGPAICAHQGTVTHSP